MPACLWKSVFWTLLLFPSHQAMFNMLYSLYIALYTQFLSSLCLWMHAWMFGVLCSVFPIIYLSILTFSQSFFICIMHIYPVTVSLINPEMVAYKGWSIYSLTHYSDGWCAFFLLSYLLYILPFSVLPHLYSSPTALSNLLNILY